MLFWINQGVANCAKVGTLISPTFIQTVRSPAGEHWCIVNKLIELTSPSRLTYFSAPYRLAYFSQFHSCFFSRAPWYSIRRFMVRPSWNKNNSALQAACHFVWSTYRDVIPPMKNHAQPSMNAKHSVTPSYNLFIYNTQ